MAPILWLRIEWKAHNITKEDSLPVCVLLPNYPQSLFSLDLGNVGLVVQVNVLCPCLDKRDDHRCAFSSVKAPVTENVSAHYLETRFALCVIAVSNKCPDQSWAVYQEASILHPSNGCDGKLGAPLTVNSIPQLHTLVNDPCSGSLRNQH